MQEYESSILSEIRNYNIFLYSILRQAECTFIADDEMTLTIEKNVIAEERLEELLQILEKIFCERCGMHFKVQTVFKEPVESKSHKNSELRIQQEVDAILQNAVLVIRKSLRICRKKTDRWRLQKRKERQKRRKKKKQNRKRKTTERARKKSRNKQQICQRQRKFPGKRRIPFRIFQRRRISQRASLGQSGCAYGRDFESESLAIEQIQGEMGEVTIRGQVQTLETRDIRNNKTIIMMEVTDLQIPL